MKTLLLILGGAYILRKLMRKNPTGLRSDVISMMIINFDNRDENGRVECKTTYTNGSTSYCFCEEGFLYQLIKDAFKRGADCVSIIKNGEPKNYYSLKELNPFIDYFSTPTDLQIAPTFPSGDKRRKL